jgi:hypothetical protein
MPIDPNPDRNEIEAKHPDCRDSVQVRTLDVSLCRLHGVIELWINDKPYSIADSGVEYLIRTLAEALAEKEERGDQ